MNAKEFIWQCGGSRILFDINFGDQCQYTGSNPDVFEELRHRGCTRWVQAGKFVATRSVVIAALQIRWFDEYSYDDACEIHQRGDMRMMKALVDTGANLTHACIAASQKQDLELVKFLIAAGCRTFIMQLAIQTGKIEWVRLFHAVGAEFYPSHDMEYAAHRNLDILKFIHENGGVLSERVYTAAVHCRSIQMLQYLDQHKCPIPADICSAAALINNIEILEYLVARGYGLDEATFSEASSVKTFQWLLDHKCPISNAAIATVFRASRDYTVTLTTLKYLISVGCKPDFDSWLAAVRYDNCVYIKWCLDHLFPITDRMLTKLYNHDGRNNWVFNVLAGADPTAADASFKFTAIHFSHEMAQFISNSKQKPCQVSVIDKKSNEIVCMHALPTVLDGTAASTETAETAASTETALTKATDCPIKEGMLAIIKKYEHAAYTYTYSITLIDNDVEQSILDCM